MQKGPEQSPASPGASRSALGRVVRPVRDGEHGQGLRLQPTKSGRTIAWSLAAALLLANVAGYAFDLYQRFWWFDRVLHACTLFALTFWAAIFLCGKALNGTARHRPIHMLLIACVGVAAGAWWEEAEWGFDQLMPANVIKGKFDTVLDLIMDSLGAALAAWLSLKVLRPAPEPDDA